MSFDATYLQPPNVGRRAISGAVQRQGPAWNQFWRFWGDTRSNAALPPHFQPAQSGEWTFNFVTGVAIDDLDCDLDGWDTMIAYLDGTIRLLLVKNLYGDELREFSESLTGGVLEPRTTPVFSSVFNNGVSGS